MTWRTPSRLPNGISNGLAGKPSYDWQMPDPSRFHVYFNDFDNYVAGDWTLTETQAGATQAMTDGDGGQLLFTNSAADDDLCSLQKVGESFLFEPNQPIFFKARFKVSDATDSDVAMGLCITDTTPIASVPSDAMYFLKADDATSLIFKVGKASSYTNSGTLMSLANATFVTVGFFCNGKGRLSGGVTYYDFDIFAGTGLNPDFVAKLAVPSTNCPTTEELTPTMALQNGAAAAKTMTIDYILAGKGRW